jgi:type I restriction enzyme S subunit
MSKNKLIPELRFPEFRNEGEWKESVLGSVVEMKGRIGYRGYTTEDIVDKGRGAITLSPSNFNENGHLNFEKCTYISWDKYEESPEIQLEEGQTVLVKTASVGKTAYVDKLPEKATVNPQIVVLKPKSIHNRFLAFTVSHQNTQNQIRNNVGAGAIPNISQEIISKLEILLPPDVKRKEQQKIASCLSTLDEVITAHNQKLELLKDHKKGLMQNLFPQPSESGLSKYKDDKIISENEILKSYNPKNHNSDNVPKYRFKEFEKDGNWSKMSLDNVITDFIVPMRDKPKNLNGEIPWCRIEDFNGMYLSGSKSSQGVSFETIKEMNLKVYPVNTLLVSCSADLGRCAITQRPLITNQTFIGLVPDLKKVDVVYLYFVMTNSRNELNARSSGTTISYLSRNQFEKFDICLPKLKEQRKIASCLSSLDSLITAQAEKIEQLKLHKKGLMQGLFPKIND